MTDIRHHKQRNCHGDLVGVTIDRDAMRTAIQDRAMLIAEESAELLLREYLANITPAWFVGPPPGRSEVAALIAERRLEAARED